KLQAPPTPRPFPYTTLFRSRKHHLLERDAKLAASANPSGPLRFDNLPAHERAHRNHDAIVACDGVRRLEIDGIAGLGGARVDAVAKHQREPCSRGDGNLSGVRSGNDRVGGFLLGRPCAWRSARWGLLRR